jgi:DNA-binding transcriptional LysR family regulator
MDLAELRIFVAVVDAGSVSRAATALHRVQSNVTTRLRQLEQKLGADLFERQGKRLLISEAGRALLPIARNMLALAQQAHEAVRPDAPHGRLRLGAMESTASVRLPRPLRWLREAHPAVSVALRTGNPPELAAAVREGALDCALVAAPVDARLFDSEVVFREPLVFVSAQATRLTAGASPDILVFEQGCPHRARLERVLAERGIAPRQVLEIGSYHALLGCVAAGMGLAVVPAAVLASFPDAGLLAARKLPRGFDHLDTLLIWRKGTQAANVAALREALAVDRLTYVDLRK